MFCTIHPEGGSTLFDPSQEGPQYILFYYGYMLVDWIKYQLWLSRRLKADDTTY